MFSPWSENMTTMVKSKAMSVIGLIAGIKLSSYQFLPLTRSRTNRVIIPARKGMPR